MEHNDDLILYLAVHVAEYELTGTVGLATCISAVGKITLRYWNFIGLA